jgi:RNA polymerase sigma-70 factor (ECF subfamily)
MISRETGMVQSTSTTVALSSRIAALKAGDFSARKELVSRAVHRLEVMTQRLRRNFKLDPMLDTGDILQEASIRLMQALEHVEINDVRHFLNLSAVKIRQTLLDMVRKGRLPMARGASDNDSSAGAPIDQAGTLTLDPANLAKWTEFHEMIQKLPDETREVVDLLWYHDLSQAEAAEVLGVAEKTINRRWLRARMQLGQWLTA